MEEGYGRMKQLPPGFRFCPSDEELVLHFLYPKAYMLPNCHPYCSLIPEFDLHLLYPWELNGKALLSGNHYFFFSQKMDNRVLENGYWKQLDMEEPIFSSGAAGCKKVGFKKFFVFYADPHLGMDTNWLMQEYHLSNSSSYYRTKGFNRKLDCSKWVLCRVEERKSNGSKSLNCSDEDDGTELSYLDEMFLSVLDDDDDLDDISSSKSLPI